MKFPENSEVIVTFPDAVVAEMAKSTPIPKWMRARVVHFKDNPPGKLAVVWMGNIYRVMEDWCQKVDNSYQRN